MIRPEDIRSLTDFKRNTPAQLRDLSKSGRPRVLTVNGRARVVVQDAAAYQKLLDAIDYAEAVAGIKRGMGEFARGEASPAREALTQALRNARRASSRPGRRRKDAA